MSIQNILIAWEEGSVGKNKYSDFDLNIKHPCRRRVVLSHQYW